MPMTGPPGYTPIAKAKLLGIAFYLKVHCTEDEIKILNTFHLIIILLGELAIGLVHSIS